MKAKNLILPLVALLFTQTLTAVAGEDLNAGKAKAAICAGCHGPAGVSMNPMWPNIAGQKKEYLRKQLAAFQDGSRKDPLMTPVAQQLNDMDIANVTAYFSSLRAE